MQHWQSSGPDRKQGWECTGQTKTAPVCPMAVPWRKGLIWVPEDWVNYLVKGICVGNDNILYTCLFVITLLKEYIEASASGTIKKMHFLLFSLPSKTKGLNITYKQS